MSFFNRFFRLFYDLSIYKTVLTQSLKSSFGFYTLFYLLFSLTIGIYLNLKFAPQFIQTATEIAQLIKSALPPTAEFVISNGNLSVSGLSAPLIIPAPVSIPLSTQYLIYLDPQADPSALATTSAFLSFGSTDARFTDPNLLESQLINYARDGFSGAITSSQLVSDLDKSISALSRLRPFTPLIIALPLFLGLFIARLIYTGVYSLMFILGSALLGRKYSFTSFLSLTLHTIIVADTINAVVVLLYGQAYPTIFSITFFGVTLFAYLNLPTAHSSNLTNPPS